MLLPNLEGIATVERQIEIAKQKAGIRPEETGVSLQRFEVIRHMIVKLKMQVICNVCMHHCSLENGQVGICRARKNEQDKIVSINYGKVTALALDPIEKKPLKKFYPGSSILSVGSFGCNLRCPFCQNSAISMATEEEATTKFISPQQLANQALELAKYGNIGVAFYL